MRVASRTVFLDTPSEVAIGTSCKAVPGSNSPSRIRRRRIEATWSATEIRLISASSIFCLNSTRGSATCCSQSWAESSVQQFPNPIGLPFLLDTPPCRAYCIVQFWLSSVEAGTRYGGHYSVTKEILDNLPCRAIAHLIHGCPESTNGALRPSLSRECLSDLKSSN